jgi:hypothetical protein
VRSAKRRIGSIKNTKRRRLSAIAAVIHSAINNRNRTSFLFTLQLAKKIAYMLTIVRALLCALRGLARRGAAGAVCGGGRRHGGRLGLGCILQRVRGL